ncbi:MAG: B12-binding domain-containing radical SAM protein [Defluviitaleaceae bacterium]|nr:B12-binding domain-containing radical SAM protein [Defluviitaleaceae bacterium]
MKILLTTLNAKFIHSSLALRNIKDFAGEYSENVTLSEFTINQTENFILSEIFKQKPDIIGFSCYIWNIKQVLSLVSSIKKIMTDVKIILGGPEVSYEFEPILRDYPVDVIVIGEGEMAFYNLLKHYVNSEIGLADISGIAYMTNEGNIISSIGEILELNAIPFAYEGGFSELENKIIYYESSRGCPYSCGYCLSGSSSNVRYLNSERVFSDLTRFLNSKVSQVKFIDRTFNSNKYHAMNIWEFLIKNDNKITNFHFEICADLLNFDEIAILKKARKGLFQFEIGIQSTNAQSLKEIGRITNLDKIYENVRLIKELGTIHQHLDLIAGLPYEDYLSFKKSFNEVFAVSPEMLQLGFLKILKGSKIREAAPKHGIIFKDNADYEVLTTSWLTYSEILQLKSIEHVLELFYNSGQFGSSIKYLISFFDSPFEFFERIAEYWNEMEYHGISHSKINLYIKIYDFAISFLNIDETKIIKELLLFDLLSNEKLKSLPDGLPFGKEENKEFVRDFYNNSENIKKYFGEEALLIPVKQIVRRSNLVWFENNVLGFLTDEKIKTHGCYVIFNYMTDEIVVNQL